jgi:hypothetical protein
MLYLFGENDGAVGLAPASPDGFKLTGRVSVQGEGPSWVHPVVIGSRLPLRYDTNLRMNGKPLIAAGVGETHAQEYVVTLTVIR